MECDEAISSLAPQAQLEALLAALSREVALIQGPPGTGKVPCGMPWRRTVWLWNFLNLAVLHREIHESATHVANNVTFG